MKHLSALIFACAALCACEDDLNMYRCNISNDSGDTLFVHCTVYRMPKDYVLPPQQSRILFQEHKDLSASENRFLFMDIMDTIAIYADISLDSCLVRETNDRAHNADALFFNADSPLWTADEEVTNARRDNAIRYRTETFHFKQLTKQP